MSHLSSPNNKAKQRRNILEPIIITITKLINDQKQSTKALMTKIGLTEKSSDTVTHDEIFQSAVSFGVDKARKSLLKDSLCDLGHSEVKNSSGSSRISDSSSPEMTNCNKATRGWEEYNLSSLSDESWDTGVDEKCSDTFEVLSRVPEKREKTFKELIDNSKTEIDSKKIENVESRDCSNILNGSRYSWLNGSVEDEINRRLKAKLSKVGQGWENVDLTDSDSKKRVKDLNTRVSTLMEEIDQTVNNFEEIDLKLVDVEEEIDKRMFESRSKLAAFKRAKCKPTTGYKGFTIDQALEGVENKLFVTREITFDDWLKEKDDKDRERKLAAEQALRDKRDRREKQRVLNVIAFSKWYDAAKNRPKPLPVISSTSIAPNATQSGPSLTWNPVPWIDDWHKNTDIPPLAKLKVKAKSSAGTVKHVAWKPNPRTAGLLKQADSWIDALLLEEQKSPSIIEIEGGKSRESPGARWSSKNSFKSETKSKSSHPMWVKSRTTNESRSCSNTEFVKARWMTDISNDRSTSNPSINRIPNVARQ